MARRWTYDRMLASPAELSDDERREAERLMSVHAARRRPFQIILWSMVVLTPMIALLTAKTARDLLMDAGLPRLIAAVAGPISVVAAWVGACIAVLWRLNVRPMRQALRDIGHDVCLQCGYSLRGLNDDVKQCPECGAAREPAAAGADP